MGEETQVVMAYLAAGDGGDDGRLRELLQANVVVHAPGDAVVVGAEPALATWQAAREGLAELRHDVVDIVDSGDVVAARVRASGVHTGTFLGVAATGRRVEVDQALFVRVADGRIAELWEVVDTGSGLRQLGVLPEKQSLSPARPAP